MPHYEHQHPGRDSLACAVTGNGYNLEVIFFPEVGVSHRPCPSISYMTVRRQIRQKFLWSFMAAAERLQVPFVPLQLMQNYCEDLEA